MSTYDVLSVHEVKATFKGIRHQPCRFMTSLCPDKCDHAKELATFAVDEYVEYVKEGQYGDEKQQTIHYALGDRNEHSTSSQPAEFDGKVKALAPGDKVLIRYEHRYMNVNGSRFPVRPFTKLERIA